MAELTGSDAPPASNEEELVRLCATIDADRLVRLLFVSFVAIEIALVLLDAFINYGRWAQYSQIRRLFNIAREDGIGTWVSSVQLLFAAMTLWCIYFRVKNQFGLKWKTMGWGLLAIFFLYLSIDDAALIHERLGSVFERYAESLADDDSSAFVGRILEVFPSYPWQLAVGPIFGLMGLFMLYFLWREFNSRSLRRYLILGLSCLVAAVGLDFVEGVEGGHEGIQRALDLDRYTVATFRQVARGVYRITRDDLSVRGLHEILLPYHPRVGYSI